MFLCSRLKPVCAFSQRPTLFWSRFYSIANILQFYNLIDDDFPPCILLVVFSGFHRIGNTIKRVIFPSFSIEKPNSFKIELTQWKLSPNNFHWYEVQRYLRDRINRTSDLWEIGAKGRGAIKGSHYILLAWDIWMMMVPIIWWRR